MYSLVQTVTPTSEPLTLAEAKLHCRVDEAADDSLITSLIVAARQYCESRLGQQLMSATWRLKLDAFPCSTIELPMPPLVSVTSVTYVDTAGSTQTLSTSYYTVDTDSKPGRVYLAYNQQWPSTQCILQSVTVTYTAGYASASLVPQAIKQAMLLLIGHWYEAREAVAFGGSPAEIPLAVDALLSSQWHGTYSLAGVTP